MTRTLRNENLSEKVSQLGSHPHPRSPETDSPLPRIRSIWSLLYCASRCVRWLCPLFRSPLRMRSVLYRIPELIPVRAEPGEAPTFRYRNQREAP